jgi:hypothetical protein
MSSDSSILHATQNLSISRIRCAVRLSKSLPKRPKVVTSAQRKLEYWKRAVASVREDS